VEGKEESKIDKLQDFLDFDKSNCMCCRKKLKDYNINLRMLDYHC